MVGSVDYEVHVVKIGRLGRLAPVKPRQLLEAEASGGKGESKA